MYKRQGAARSRAFEYKSGTVGAATAEYHNYLFDITMFTRLDVSAASNYSANALLTGVTSGATGVVVTAVSGAAQVFVMQVVGSFQTGETVTSSVSGNTQTSTILTGTAAITNFDFGRDVKSLYQDTTPIDYTSNVVLDQILHCLVRLLQQVVAQLSMERILNLALNFRLMI